MKKEIRDGHDMSALGGTVHLADWTIPAAMALTLAPAAMGLGATAINLAAWLASRRKLKVEPPRVQVMTDSQGNGLAENRLNPAQKLAEQQKLATMTYGDDPQPDPEPTPDPPGIRSGLVLAFPTLRPTRRPGRR